MSWPAEEKMLLNTFCLPLFEYRVGNKKRNARKAREERRKERLENLGTDTRDNAIFPWCKGSQEQDVIRLT